MRKLSVAIALMIVVILSSCFQEQNLEVSEKIIQETTTQAQVKFSPVKRIPLRGMHYGSLSVAGTEIYISGYSGDENLRIVEIFDKELEYKSKKTFPMGQGPGDVGGGARFFRFGDRVYAPDNTQRRINIFDRDFKFIKFIKLVEGHYPLVFIKNGEYFICLQDRGEGTGKISYDVSLFSFPGLQKKILYQIGPFPFRDHSGKHILFSMDGVDFFYREEKIYLINMNSYQVNMMDLSGKILKRSRVDVERRKVPKGKKKTWLKANLGRLYRRYKNRVGISDYIQPTSYMVPLGKGFAVVRRKGYDSLNCTGMVEADYFDYSLHLLGKIQVPCFYLVFRLSMGYYPYSYEYQDGYLYLISIDREENFYLEKWQVVENP